MTLDGTGSVSSASSVHTSTAAASSGSGPIGKVVEFFEFKSDDAKGLANLGQLPMGFCVEMASRAGKQIADTPVGEVVQDCAEYIEGNIDHNKAIRDRYCERYPILGKYMQFVGAPIDYMFHPEAYEGL